MVILFIAMRMMCLTAELDDTQITNDKNTVIILLPT